jgi:hypothetical protein
MNIFDIEVKQREDAYREGFELMQSTIKAHGVKTAMKWFNDYHRPGEPYKGTIDGYHRMKGEFDAIFKSMYKAA